MNEEKLDKIYEKLLDLEFQISKIENEKKLKELEAEKQDIKFKIDDINYTNEKKDENRAELMHMFRNIGKIEKLIEE